jgi:hypothetical protein
MSTAPIIPALEIVRKSIYTALDALTTSGVYWLQSPESAALPLVIFQSQDLGGDSVKRVGDIAWSGLVTVRALATSQGAAETLMNAIAPGMASLAVPIAYPGYTISTEYERPIVIPPADGVWQSSHQWRVTLGYS